MVGFHDKKSGYKYIKRNYHSWFPMLPTYEVYSRKLNKFQHGLKPQIMARLKYKTLPIPFDY